jgi:hypothetical protein
MAASEPILQLKISVVGVSKPRVGGACRAGDHAPLSEPRDRIRYVYDFGDDWQHDIVLEKLLQVERGAR